jgi:polyhydroxybutyrate depolymerase
VLAVWVFIAGLVGLSPTWAAESTTDARQTLMHGGMERSYVLRVPESVARSSQPVPLLLVLHGGGGNGENAERMTGFTRKAMQEGFIVAYPEGTSRGKGRLGFRMLTWNAGHCCGYAMQKNVDDVGFISALLDKLLTEYPIDPKRVYITGLSNGGMMTHRLGRELSPRIAAIAPVIATVFGDEPLPAKPVAALMINGLVDGSVPDQGGATGGCFPQAWDGRPASQGMEQVAYWAKANGCKGKPEWEENERFIHWRQACQGGKDVERYLVKDNGHAWPSGQKGSRLGDTPSQSLIANDVIWAFFKVH